MRRVKTSALTALSAACICAGIVFLQNKLTALSLETPVSGSMAYVPQSEKIKPWLLGFHTAVADYLWIRTTIYFGGQLQGNLQFPYLMHMIDIVTRLNPRFYPAYEFGGLMYSKICGNPKASIIMLQRGVCAHVEKKWKLYFYLGMLYHEYYGDNASAALYIAIAAQLPGAQSLKLTRLAASLYEKADKESQDTGFLSLLYSASENPEVRRFLFDKLNAQAPLQGVY